MKIEDILKKAHELGHLLKKNEIVVRYRKLAEDVERHAESRKRFETLVQLSETARLKEMAGEKLTAEDEQAITEAEAEVRKDDLLVQFLATQRYYMALMSQVNEAISNPKGDPPRESGIILPGEEKGRIVLP